MDDIFEELEEAKALLTSALYSIQNTPTTVGKAGYLTSASKAAYEAKDKVRHALLWLEKHKS